MKTLRNLFGPAFCLGVALAAVAGSAWAAKDDRDLVSRATTITGAPHAVAARACTLTGTAGPNRLVGTARSDVTCGLGGTDLLQGKAGADRLFGDAGNDDAYGGAGRDVLRGGRGDDGLGGGLGPDRLSGGPGRDIVFYGQRGRSVRVTIGTGADDGARREHDDVRADVEGARGGHGNDVLTGNAAANELFGGGGRDQLVGSGGSDVLDGGDGDDRVDAREPAGAAAARSGARDRVICGGGTDIALVDPEDVVDPGCEQVVGASTQPSPPVNHAPAAIVLSDAAVAENEPAGTTVGVLSARDPDVGDTATFALVPGAGSTDNRSFEIVGSQLRTADVLDFEARPTYSVRIRATDSGTPAGHFVTTFTITVTDANDTPPVADAKTATTDEDTASPPITLSASDPEGGDITQFDTSGADHGTLGPVGPITCGGAPKVCTADVTFTPDEDYNGPATFTYTAGDGTYVSDAATVSITVGSVNDTPAAADGSRATDQDSPMALDLASLAGDLETADGDLTYTIVDQPAHGTATPTTYTPDAGFNGADSLTFNVTDRGDPDNCGAAAPACDAAETSQTRTVSIAIARTGCYTDDSQSDFEAGTSSGCDLTGNPGSMQLSTVSVDQSNATIGTLGAGLTTANWGGQTFTPDHTGQLTRVDLNIFCAGCTGTTPDVTLSIRATDGGRPTGADLASATIPGFSSGSADYHTATFASPITVAAGTQYAIVVRPNANPAPGTYALTRSGTNIAGANVYPGGTRIASMSSGTNWSIPLTGGVTTDAGFNVWLDGAYASSGTFVSSVKDADPAAGVTPTWTTLSFTATTPANTAVAFQVAASDSSTGPFTFVGPDGTPDTFFTTSGADLSQFNGLRYLRYKAFLSTTDRSATPAIESVQVCFRNAIRGP